jgi:SAM-dependent methyltransferase
MDERPAWEAEGRRSAVLGEDCSACGRSELVVLADLGKVPVRCGVHWAEQADALASPLGAMTLAYCRHCGYVRNVVFDPDLVVYDTTMDMDLHFSPAFRKFTGELVAHIAGRFPLAGARVLDLGCAQGEFLRALCQRAGCQGTGWDPAYAGPAGADPSGATFHTGFPPRGDQLPEFDAFVSRHWLEHLADPYQFLVDLRERAGDRVVYGYLEVPDAGYDLAGAGWQLIYPHVSYFDAYSLCRIASRSGWQVDATGSYFSGTLRWVEISANRLVERAELPGLAARDRQLAAIRGLAARYAAERDRWRKTIGQLADDGARPVLWGAGSRSVQFLAATDPDRRLAGVVDVNPRKWGRYLPGGGHRVDSPESLVRAQPRAVILMNPAYQDEIRRSLSELGVNAELLLA